VASRRRLSIMNIALIAVLVVCAFASGNGNAATVTVEQVETAMREAADRTLHAKSLSLKIEPFESGNWTEKGRFKSIVAEAEEADVDDLKIDWIRVKLFDVRLNLEALFEHHLVKVVSAQNNMFSARISESAINRFLAKRNKRLKIKNLRVDFKGSKVEATGVYNLWGLGNKVKVLGYFQVKSGRLLYFFVEKAWVNGIPLPAGQVRNLMRKMNPVLNLEKVVFQPNLRNVAIEDEQFILLSS